MIDIADFIEKRKAMLIAPAGYGKTYTISAGLDLLSESGKQLVLTHTHAGVAAIKEKVAKTEIPSKSFHIETISSFCQRYVMAFYNGNDIPSQDLGGKYYSFILEKATHILARECVASIVRKSFTGLFVDEYQDCTVSQHELINVISDFLPTRILGDPLQGIFGFKGDELVDLDNTDQMASYCANRFELEKPQRWLRGNNAQLGEDLKSIRQSLVSNAPINLSSFSAIENYVWPAADIFHPQSDYSRKIRELLRLQNVLFIHPVSNSINPRLAFAKKFGGQLIMLEAIDAKELYDLAKIADRKDNEEPVMVVREMAYLLFNKSALNTWFNAKGLKRKSKEEDKAKIEPIKEFVLDLSKDYSFTSLAELLKQISNLPDIKKFRRDLYDSIYWALKEADANGTSVQKAMENKRNKLRQVGRKVYGRCLGTTLLTKGLEFDNVVVIDAHKFECPKHLYVALTRASKRLIVISESNTISPY